MRCFRTKTVFDNVAFGLKYRNVSRPEIVRRVGSALEMVRLPGSEKKLPHQLSGGQQQRIALARPGYGPADVYNELGKENVTSTKIERRIRRSLESPRQD